MASFPVPSIQNIASEPWSCGKVKNRNHGAHTRKININIYGDFIFLFLEHQYFHYLWEGKDVLIQLIWHVWWIFFSFLAEPCIFLQSWVWPWLLYKYSLIQQNFLLLLSSQGLYCIQRLRHWDPRKYFISSWPICVDCLICFAAHVKKSVCELEYGAVELGPCRSVNFELRHSLWLKLLILDRSCPFFRGGQLRLV